MLKNSKNQILEVPGSDMFRKAFSFLTSLKHLETIKSRLNHLAWFLTHEKALKNILTLLLCSALCYSLSDVYSKLSKNYEIIIELENRHENTKQLIFDRQEHLAREFETVQKKIFDLEKSMLEDMKHVIADLKEKQLNNQFQIDEIEKMNLSKLGELPKEVEKLGLKLRTIQANINGILFFEGVKPTAKSLISYGS